MTATPAPEAVLGGDTEDAYAYAIRLLAQAPRTERLIRDRLERAGFDAGTTDAAVARLATARLVDDDAYARDFVEARARRRPLSRTLLMGELEARGVDPVAAALAVEAVGHDEQQAAIELATSRLARLTSFSLPEQARRLYSFLASRGFAEDVAEAALRKVLPPEGWD